MINGQSKMDCQISKFLITICFVHYCFTPYPVFFLSCIIILPSCLSKLLCAQTTKMHPAGIYNSVHTHFSCHDLNICFVPGPFHSSTGNVSAHYETDITPAGWTFSIWGVIYTWLTLMVIYITTYVFRGYCHVKIFVMGHVILKTSPCR